MADKPKEKDSYVKALAHFYFAPELRSICTLAYLAIFSYFTLYYINNVFLAIHFLVYVLFGHTALSGIALLFTGLAFVISLAMPFVISLYAIFVLHKIWDKPEWAGYVKWLVSILIILGGLLVIIVSDTSARLAARQPVMQSFVEDANLMNRI